MGIEANYYRSYRWKTFGLNSNGPGAVLWKEKRNANTKDQKEFDDDQQHKNVAQNVLYRGGWE